MGCFNFEGSLVIILDFHTSSKRISGYRVEYVLEAGFVGAPQAADERHNVRALKRMGRLF